MTERNTKLELTWSGKKNWPKLELYNLVARQYKELIGTQLENVGIIVPIMYANQWNMP
ncbi:MAG: hypothetical protein WCJ97_06955 [Phycisphaerae bacterium]